MVQLAARAHRTSEERHVEHPIYFEPATIFCLCVLIPSTLRATQAPWPSRAGPPSSLRMQLKSDTSTFEYERHRACLSVKTSNDEPSHVPLHARTLRGVALSSWWSSLWSLSAQAARRGFRGIMEALNWYWRCTACIFFVFKCVTVYLKWWKTGMRGYFLFTTALRYQTFIFYFRFSDFDFPNIVNTGPNGNHKAPQWLLRSRLLATSTAIYASPCHTVEVLVVVRAGVIKLLEYPPDRQGYNWLVPKLFTEKWEMLSTSTSPRWNFAANCSRGSCWSVRVVE